MPRTGRIKQPCSGRKINSMQESSSSSATCRPASERKVKMTDSENEWEDETRITARLIDLICDMSIGQQLELLEQLDKKQFKGGRSDFRL